MQFIEFDLLDETARNLLSSLKSQFAFTILANAYLIAKNTYRRLFIDGLGHAFRNKLITFDELEKIAQAFEPNVDIYVQIIKDDMDIYTFRKNYSKLMNKNCDINIIISDYRVKEVNLDVFGLGSALGYITPLTYMSRRDVWLITYQCRYNDIVFTLYSENVLNTHIDFILPRLNKIRKILSVLDIQCSTKH